MSHSIFSRLLLFTFFLTYICPGIVLFANVYYVDPANGDINNSGDFGHPWDTLENVFRLGKFNTLSGGDSLLLLNGHHGSVSARCSFDSPIVIAPYSDHHPTLTRIRFTSAVNIHLTGVTISPEFAGYDKMTLVAISSSASHITVENCKAFSVADNSEWSAHDWSQNSCTGAAMDGSQNVIRNCHFLNVKHGILVEAEAEHNLISENIVENFAADGMRSIGSFNTFEYNTVKNCYNVDDNHDDGFQSYSYGPDGVGKTTVRGIVLRGNTIINHTDENQPFKGPLQGIGCFDGMYEDWVVENNVIIVDHWHGIALYGARNCRIINNTVIDLTPDEPGPAWIRITAHKNGTPSTDNIVRNNLTTDLSLDRNIGEIDHNLVIAYDSYDDYFVNAGEFDLRLVAGCPAIDAGSAEQAPDVDLREFPRPQGQAIDVGAFEFGAATGLKQRDTARPESFGLHNYPNPFNPRTHIQYELSRHAEVDVSIFNLLGEHITTLAREKQPPGIYRLVFDGKQFPSGLYLCRLQSDGYTSVRKITLQK